MYLEFEFEEGNCLGKAPKSNLFLAQLILTQGPIKHESEIIYDYEDGVEIKIPKTWFRNYFRDLTVYGLELSTEGEKLTWKFFLNSQSEYEAEKRGKALLLYLEKLLKLTWKHSLKYQL